MPYAFAHPKDPPLRRRHLPPPRLRGCWGGSPLHHQISCLNNIFLLPYVFAHSKDPPLRRRVPPPHRAAAGTGGSLLQPQVSCLRNISLCLLPLPIRKTRPYAPAPAAFPMRLRGCWGGSPLHHQISCLNNIFLLPYAFAHSKDPPLRRCHVTRPTGW
jgi:hypothetical protein